MHEGRREVFERASEHCSNRFAFMNVQDTKKASSGGVRASCSQSEVPKEVPLSYIVVVGIGTC